MTKENLIQTLSLIQKEFDQKDAQFQEFLEIAPEGIAILDLDPFTFVKCNSNAEKLLKYPFSELFGKGPECLCPEMQPNGRSSAEMISEIIEQALQGHAPVFEWLTVDGTGSSFMAEVRLVLLTNSEKPQIYASFVDITERKAAQKKLELQNEKLKQIAFLQSHQVRQPVANLMGLFNLFNFNDLNDPLNAELLHKVYAVSKEFDGVIREITWETLQINEFLSKSADHKQI